MTSHKFMELDVDWNSTDNKYHTRLVLGKASDIVTDIRFAVAGYIENIHTAWFGENSSAPPYQASHGAKITTYLSGGNVTDLVFFDPQNTSGKTLSELVGAAGLWESSVGGETYLTTPEHINLKGYMMRGSTSASGNLVLVGTSHATTGQIQSNDELTMTGNNIVDINTLKAYSTNNLSFWDNTTGTKTLSELASAGASALNDLSDVTIDGTPANDELLAYSGAGQWINQTAAEAGVLALSGGTMGGAIAMGGSKITGLATGTVSGDAVALDGDGYVPILDLPLGGTGVRGDLFVGTNAGCSTIQSGANGLVLTADSAQTAGVKWAAVGAGSGLWQSTGTPARTSLIATQPIDLYDDIDMHGKDIDNLYRIDAHDASGVGLYDHNGSWRAVLANPSYAMQCLNAGIDMNDTQKITSLVAGSGAGDSVRYEQVLLLAGGTMSGEGADINMAQAMLTNAGGISLYDASDYIDMNGGDVRDISELSGQYTSQFAYDHVYFKGHKSGVADVSHVFMEWDGYNLQLDMGETTNKIDNLYDIAGQASPSRIKILSNARMELHAHNTTYLTIGAGTYSNTVHCHKHFVPNTTGTEQCGFSTRKWAACHAITFYQGDAAYTETTCAKCGETFQIGDAIVHVMLENDEIDGSTVTIPIHATCAQQDKKLVEIDRYEREIIEFFVEDDGTVEKRWESKIQKKLYNKLVLKDGVKKDKDGFYVRDGKRLAKAEIFDVVESTREVPVMVKKKYLI